MEQGGEIVTRVTKPEPEFRKWEVDFPKCQLELAKMIS